MDNYYLLSKHAEQRGEEFQQEAEANRLRRNRNVDMDNATLANAILRVVKNNKTVKRR